MPHEYTYQLTLPEPSEYPKTFQPDSFSTECFAMNYEDRRTAFFEFLKNNPARDNFKAAFHEVGRMAAGDNPHLGILQAALDYINQRRDCADFVMHSIIRLLYQFPNHPILPYDFYKEAELVVLGFKYWPDEPGFDSMCTWTENHHILFASAAYLAGQLYPQAEFTNSRQSGEQKKRVNRERILRWLDLRFQTGFSEWLSHVYYDEDLAALINLVEFCDDLEIVEKSKKVIDLILLDIAINSFKGVFASTHGRSYEWVKKDPAEEATTAVSKLMFGRGIFSMSDNMSAVLFALSEKYKLPVFIFRVANEDPVEFNNRQRMGIRLSELHHWGLDPDRMEDGMALLTLEAYLHPRTITGFVNMLDAFKWWDNEFFSPFAPYRGLLKMAKRLRLLPLLARVLEKDITRNTREEVNLITYRTRYYQLSTAVDYRKGYGGDQQHIWQASLGGKAVCFTTHPARLSGRVETPNYWAGSGLLPRAAQYKNVTVVLYKLKSIPALYVPVRHFYTHAWLPKNEFDEVLHDGHWVFARKGKAYLGLYSSNPTFWNMNGISPVPGLEISKEPNNFGNEIVALGKRQVWLCELGDEEKSGSFTDFCQCLRMATPRVSGLSVTYQSPSQGLVKFAWQGDFIVDGKTIPLKEFPRYDNPYGCVPFGSKEMVFEDKEGNFTLVLD
ncbi:MAG: hypothetical protein CL609_05760 [Anaerolineaceae bacterium]|nr:hypothetical protein [Anaerolineaceae bacterium]